MKKHPIYYVYVLASMLLYLAMYSCQQVQTNSSKAGTIKVALREAGNQLLLKQKDSISLILPIVEKSSNQFELSFQSQLSFEPSQLVTSIDSSFTVAGLSKNYRVEVLQCTDSEVAYSYEMRLEEERTIIPCSGRKLSEQCYTIEVNFIENTEEETHSILGAILLIGVIILLLLLYFRKHNKGNRSSEDNENKFAKIGSFQFYPEQNKLVKAATEISLSKKECELLEILVANLNQVVKRDELTKKVWEDNGVIVGRSLDTYISKLRKKLRDDDGIKITNVHGVGYKLEIN